MFIVKGVRPVKDAVEPMEEGESVEDCARRELYEERAWCDAMHPWFTVWLSPRCAAAVMRKIFFRRFSCATSVVRLFFLKKNTAGHG